MGTATLIDGSQADTASEAWRHECEARAVLALPLGKRRDHLQGYRGDDGRVHKGVEQQRGLDERRRLENTMRRIWVNKQVALLKAMPRDDERVALLLRIEQSASKRMREVVERAFDDDNNNQGSLI